MVMFLKPAQCSEWLTLTRATYSGGGNSWEGRGRHWKEFWGRGALGVLERAGEEGRWVAEAGAARELVQRHGEGCPRSGSLSQGSGSLSGCRRETWTRQES